MRAGLALGTALAGCNDECVVHPCPYTVGAELTITAAGTGKPPADLVIRDISGQQARFSCDANGLCLSGMGIGDYHLEISAPGYTSQQLDVSITGTEGGCNRCAHFDTQRRTIVLNPS